MYIFERTGTRIRVYGNECTYMYMYVCIYIRKYRSIYVHMYMYVRMYVCA